MNGPQPNQAEPGGSHVVVLLPRAGRAPAAGQVLERLLPQVRRLVAVDEPATVMLELHRGAQSVVLLDSRREAHGELLAAMAQHHADTPVFFAEIDIATRRLSWRPAREQEQAAPVATAHAGGRQATIAADRASALLTEEELAMLMTPLGEAP